MPFSKPVLVRETTTPEADDGLNGVLYREKVEVSKPRKNSICLADRGPGTYRGLPFTTVQSLPRRPAAHLSQEGVGNRKSGQPNFSNAFT